MKIDRIQKGLRDLMHLCSVPEEPFDPFEKYKTDFALIEQDEYVPTLRSTYELRDEVDDLLKKEQLLEVLKTLTEREQIVLHCRFFENITLEKTGHRIGVGKERARGIESKALRKLRHSFRSEKLMKLYFPERHEKEKISKLAELAQEKEMMRIQEEERQAQLAAELLFSYSYVDIFGNVKWVVR